MRPALFAMLFVALGLSAGAALAGLLGGVRIALPFGAVLALGLLALAALHRARRVLGRDGRPAELDVRASPMGRPPPGRSGSKR